MSQSEKVRLAKDRADDRRQRAKSLIVHYFHLSGAITNGDNRAELEELVDLLIAAAVFQMQAEAESR